jgi:hypothetical protein
LAATIPQSTGIAALINASNEKAPATETTTSFFGEDGFTFGDIIDIVNPLQHIPIINNIYRKISGDTIAPAMKIAGGALFGGPIGAFTSMVTTAFSSQDKIDSADPESPYIDKDPTTLNSNALASHSSQQFPKNISIDDYTSTNNAAISQTNYSNPARTNSDSWILTSSNIQKKVTLDDIGNNNVSVIPMPNERTYQPADGIVNPAYKNTDIYKNVITSTETPEKTIDILIGATSDAG